LLASLILLFPILAFMAGLAAGGGAEVMSTSYLVAFPLGSRALYVASLVLTPLNVAWLLQALSIAWLWAYVAAQTRVAVVGLALALVYLLTATTVGLSMSWLVTGVRASWRGRRIVDGVVVSILLLAAWYVWRTGSEDALAALPLSDLAVAMLLPDETDLIVWPAALGLLTLVAILGGFGATRWTLGRRDDAADRREGASRPRRAWLPDHLRSLLAVDIASVLRSRPIRRGIVLFAAVPGAAAAMVAMPWDDMVILPGLVATGACLLYGINAFSLDGSGATWLESTPRDPTAAFLSKAITVAATTVVIALLSLLPPGIRAWRDADISSTVVVVMSVVGAVALSTAISLRQSVERPFHAALRGARDTPAPPATMTAHSLRLIVGTSIVGFAFVVAARLPGVLPAVGLTLLVAALSTGHLYATLRRWRSLERRNEVVRHVSSA
jgi:hypothetical protein